MAKHFKLEEPEIIESMLSERLDAELKLPRLNPSKDILVSPATISASDKALIAERFAEDYEVLGYVPVR